MLDVCHSDPWDSGPLCPLVSSGGWTGEVGQPHWSTAFLLAYTTQGRYTVRGWADEAWVVGEARSVVGVKGLLV